MFPSVPSPWLLACWQFHLWREVNEVTELQLAGVGTEALAEAGCCGGGAEAAGGGVGSEVVEWEGVCGEGGGGGQPRRLLERGELRGGEQRQQRAGQQGQRAHRHHEIFLRMFQIFLLVTRNRGWVWRRGRKICGKNAQLVLELEVEWWSGPCNVSNLWGNIFWTKDHFLLHFPHLIRYAPKYFCVQVHNAMISCPKIN